MGISIVVIGGIMESRYTISRDLKLYRQLLLQGGYETRCLSGFFYMTPSPALGGC